jgi:hypothetical protein
MTRLWGSGALVLLLALTAPAQAAYLWFENFEDGMAGWTKWEQRVTVSASGAVAEPPTLGDIQPQSGANAMVARTGGSNYNGGYFTVVSGLPTNTVLTIDGFFRHASTFQTNKDWEEVQVIEGALNYTPGSDITGNLEYKHDSYGGRGNFGNSQLSVLCAVVNDGDFTTASGTVTVVIKYGNTTGSTQIWAEYDDLHITPEPATLLLLGLPALFLRRRRF